jgi:tetratricopeptide (TPR) repeat protein
MTAAKFDTEEWLTLVTKLADLSDAARETTVKGVANYALSVEYAQSVIVALTYGFLTSAEAIHGSSHAEDTFKAIQRLRWRVELGLGIALSLEHRTLDTHKDWLVSTDLSFEQRKQAARDLLLAEKGISKALSLATDSPSPSENPWFLTLPVELIPPNKQSWFTELERAQTWYALGIVHTSLSEYLFAAGAFERALGMWGSNEGIGKVEAAFEKARLGIESDRAGMFSGRIQPGMGLRGAVKIARARGD